MSERRRDLRLGVFVLGALALLVAGLLFLGLRDRLQPRLRLETAVVGEVAGLSVGSAVLLRGIPVGEVTWIGFTWQEYPGTRSDLALVRFSARESVFASRSSQTPGAELKDEVAKGLRARVRGQPLTGTAVLVVERVDPVDNPPPPIDYAPRDLYIPSARSELARMMASLDRTLESLEQVKVGPILAHVDQLVSSLDRVAKNAQEIRFGVLQKDAEKAIADVALAARQIGAAADAARAEVSGLELARTGADARAVLADLREAIDDVRAATGSLKGTLEKLGSVDTEGLNEAIETTRRAAERLDETLQEVQSYPGSVVLGSPPPRPASVEKKK